MTFPNQGILAAASRNGGAQMDTESNAGSDPTYLTLSPDNIVLALQKFHYEQEQRIINQ